MLNMVILVGRLGRDAKTEKTAGEMKDICRFSLAIKANANANTEWIDCVAFDQPSRYIGSYGKKGALVLVVGHIHKSSNEKDGKKLYRQNVVVDRIKLLERKSDADGYQSEVIKAASTAIIDDPQYIDPFEQEYAQYGFADTTFGGAE